jgi:hypothetical protein
VDRAGADDDEQPVILAVEDAFDGRAVLGRGDRARIRRLADVERGRAAESTRKCRREPAPLERSSSTAWAEGDRQILPRQTNRTPTR